MEDANRSGPPSLPPPNIGHIHNRIGSLPLLPPNNGHNRHGLPPLPLTLLPPPPNNGHNRRGPPSLPPTNNGHNRRGPPPPPPPNNGHNGPNDNGGFFNKLSPGYRFYPDDEELVVDYLKVKIMDPRALPKNDRIWNVDIYKFNPETLAGFYMNRDSNKARDKDMYFFTPRERKYPKGERPKRSTCGGFWKATGADKAVESNGGIVGFKKTLVFYRGSPPHGNKTDWIMQEYRFNAPKRKKKGDKDMTLDDCVLCKMYKKPEKSSKSAKQNNPVPEDPDEVQDWQPVPIYQDEVQDPPVPIYEDQHDPPVELMNNSLFDPVYQIYPTLDQCQELYNGLGNLSDEADMAFYAAALPSPHCSCYNNFGALNDGLCTNIPNFGSFGGYGHPIDDSNFTMNPNSGEDYNFIDDPSISSNPNSADHVDSI